MYLQAHNFGSSAVAEVRASSELSGNGISNSGSLPPPEEALSPEVFEMSVSPTEATTISDQTELPNAAANHYDWSDPKLNKEFSRLESKWSAGKVSQDEAEVYTEMRGSRRAYAFSKDYLDSYAETHRLRMLSKALKEVEQYLRPIKFELAEDKKR